ncbi:MAG: hypothetical protein ORN23_07595 [Chthoniobacterales bacterium]|nr:hypothetical protein [Chthoniobacterales bacterium]
MQFPEIDRITIEAGKRTGMPQWRKTQAALPPGSKLEKIARLIQETRQLETIKRHATRL